MKPNEAAAELTEHIKKEIYEAGGMISFYRFMEIALYHPTQGYYMKPGSKVGIRGDFYTVSSLGPLMAEQLASTMSEMKQNIDTDHLTLLEWGGGEGTLSKQMMDAWRSLPEPNLDGLQWIMLEASPDHRAKQKHHLAQSPIPVRWIDDLSELTKEERKSLIIFSNELLDAFPIYRVINTEDGLKEYYVGWDDSKQSFIWVHQPARQELEDYIRDYQVHLDIMQEAEINLDQDRWMRQVAHTIEKGYVMTIDYGDVTDRLYSPHRMEGTLLAYYKHQAVKEVLERPGEQDLTSHVHFTACIREGERNGLQTVGLMTQREFLLNSGILDKVVTTEQRVDPFTDERIKRNRMIRQLMTPGGMNETFKVLIQSKNVDQSDHLACMNRFWDKQ